MKLDSPLGMFLAQEIGYCIVFHWEGSRAGQSGHVREEHKTKNPRKTIMIDYSGNAAGGHYQAIVPEGGCVSFR
jgi:hypothetical protein